MRLFLMFVTAVCVLFLIKLRWPKEKSQNFLSSLVNLNIRGPAESRLVPAFPCWIYAFQKNLPSTTTTQQKNNV